MGDSPIFSRREKCMSNVDKEQNLPNNYDTFVETTANIPPLKQWKIICLTCGMIGNQLIWALQNGNASAYFLSMGMPDALVGVAWLAGPIGGILVQPIIGTFSDRNEARWGRRRPYMIASLLTVILFSVLFSNGYSIGYFLGDTDDNHLYGLIIAVISFWGLDCAINGLQAMLRALYVDLAPPEQHPKGMAWFSWMNSFGNIIGYGLGMFNYTQIGFATNVQALYSLGIIILCFTVFVTIVVGKEKRFVPDKEEKERLKKIKEKRFGNFRESMNQLIRMVKNITKFPKPLRWIWAVQFFAWFSWFIIMLYGTIWIAVDIFDGDPDAASGTTGNENYEKGVRAGNFCLMAQALFSMMYSLVLPLLMAKIEVRILYGAAQIIQAVAMSFAFWVTAPWQAFLILSILAIPWSTTWTIPWSLTSTAVTNSPHKALYLGTLNLSQVVPEILCGLLANVILFFYDGFGMLISIGGLVAAASFLFVPFIPVSEISAMALLSEIEV